MHQVIKEDIAAILSARKDLESFRGCTLLISGANSFIMSYIIYALLENNRRNDGQTRIIALCRNRENAENRFKEYLDDPGLCLMIQDVRDPITYDGNIDYCIHAASPAGINSRQEYPADTYLINLLGCLNLLEFCKNKNVKKFLFLSSVDVYGKNPEQGRLKESDKGILDWIYKRNAYSNGKRASETLCSLYYEQYGMPCMIARPFQVYGPGMSLTDGRLHGDFIRQITENNKILLKSDGTAQRSFMYLTDAANAMFDVILYGAAGEIYNICDEKSECSVYELAKMYADVSKTGAKVEFIYDLGDTPEVREALSVVLGDGKKLKKLCGEVCRTSLRDGIERTLRSYGMLNAD